MGELNRLTKSAQPVGTIATLYQGKVAGETLTSYMRMDTRFARGRDPDMIYVKGSQVPAQRNLAVHQMRGDWIIFIDSDMEFGPHDVQRLVTSYEILKTQIEEPIIVGGLCCRRYPPYEPTIYRALDMEDGPFRVIEKWDGADYVECDATGMAFVLIELGVFEAIMGGPMPSFDERVELTPWPYYEWVGRMGEDFRFCLRAKAAGARVFVDPGVIIGHVADVTIGIADYWRQMATRTDEAYETARAINDELEMPTLDRQKALELLG